MAGVVISEETSDEQLMALIADGHVQALDLFYDRHSQAVYGVILRIVRSPQLADEVLQETFWQLWKKASSYAGRGVPAAWLFRIARNKSIDLVRRQQVRPEAVMTATEEADDRLWAQLEDGGADVGQEVHARWQRDQVHHALADLPEEQRLCLELAFFRGLTQREIAEQTGTPLGTIKTRTRLALAKMQRILSGIHES